MDNQENELSLSQLFDVFKKSLIRGLIYVLVTIITATAVLVLVKTFSSTNVYSANISFSKTDDTTLSSLNSYKANVVNKAITADGKSLDISDEIIGNLSVSAVIPEDKEKDSSFTPTSFTVSLKTDSGLNLSSGEYKSLVDNIAKEFVNKFATSSMPELSENVVDVNAQLQNNVEYLQIAYYLSDIIDNYLEDLNSFASSNSATAAFVVNGTTLNGIISDLIALKSSIDNIKYTIAIKKYTFGNLDVYLDTAEVSTDAEVAKYTTICEGIETLFEKYNTSIENLTKDENGSNVYLFDVSPLADLVETAKSNLKLLGIATAKNKAIKSLKEAFTSSQETAAQNEGVATLLKSSATTLTYALASYKALATEFNDNKTAISPATVSKPAYSVAESFINIKIILIADVAFALIAYLFAFSQTFTIMKKKGQLN